jgi:exonuclease III
MISGDFNIIRGPNEKNNSNYNDRWPFLFNAIIDAFNYRELVMSGRQYTWENNMQNPTFEKLDKVLASTEWESKFTRTTVQALTREISDNTPLFLNTGSINTWIGRADSTNLT